MLCNMFGIFQVKSCAIIIVKLRDADDINSLREF